ncbi:MAG: YbjN domain-containing protein [Crocinitomicaceae bacterium]|nr:YbjN domain-containing protein [Crocinitomicaceae bacterium]
MKNSFVFIVLFSLLFVQCRKDRQIPFCKEFPEECVDIIEGQKYMSFGLGSYWIYQEENTGLRDTVYVVESLRSENSYYFSTKVYSTYDSCNYRYWPVLGSGCPDSGLVKNDRRCLVMKKSKTKPSQFISENFFFFLWPEENEFIYNYVVGYGDSQLSFIQFDNMRELGVFKFNKVYSFYDEFSNADGNQSTIYRISENVGIIQKELIDSSQTWNLIEYEVF